MVPSLVAVAVAACALGCSNVNTNYGSAFVGTWSCPASLAQVASTLSITENLDDSLTLTSESDAGESDAGGLFCATDSWNYSGSTASMNSGTSCTVPATGADVVVTVNTFALSVSGNKLNLRVNETVVAQAEYDGAPGGPVTTTKLSVSGACTKE